MSFLRLERPSYIQCMYNWLPFSSCDTWIDRRPLRKNDGAALYTSRHQTVCAAPLDGISQRKKKTSWPSSAAYSNRKRHQSLLSVLSLSCVMFMAIYNRGEKLSSRLLSSLSSAPEINDIRPLYSYHYLLCCSHTSAPCVGYYIAPLCCAHLTPLCSFSRFFLFISDQCFSKKLRCNNNKWNGEKLHSWKTCPRSDGGNGAAGGGDVLLIYGRQKRKVKSQTRRYLSPMWRQKVGEPIATIAKS